MNEYGQVGVDPDEDTDKQPPPPSTTPTQSPSLSESKDQPKKEETLTTDGKDGTSNQKDTPTDTMMDID